MKLFIVDYYKKGTCDYIVADQDEIVPLIKEALDEATWKILIQALCEYWGETFYGNDITWEMLETANHGYIEDENVAFYCETPITKRNEL